MKPGTARRSRGCWIGISGSKKPYKSRTLGSNSERGCSFFFLLLTLPVVSWLCLPPFQQRKTACFLSKVVPPKVGTLSQRHYSMNQQANQRHLRNKKPSRIKHPAYISETSLNPSTILVLFDSIPHRFKKRTKRVLSFEALERFCPVFQFEIELMGLLQE